MLHTRITSSVEKCFLDQNAEDFAPLSFIRMMKNQRLSLQFLYQLTEPFDFGSFAFLKVQLSGVLADYAEMHTVEQAAVLTPIGLNSGDENYLRKTPGLYPDWLQEMHHEGKVLAVHDQLRSLWIELAPFDRVPAGTYPLTVTLWNNDQQVSENTVTVEILDADLPEQPMKVVHWFHPDCLANYYDCEPWSERHWKIVEAFAASAAKYGLTGILMPLYTPPLDTQIGHERRPCQLLEITVTDGQYAFGFDKVDRWIDMCDRVGLPDLEITHLFSQWGAEHAPNIRATVIENGEKQENVRIFGWDDAACGERYVTFLNAMLPAFIEHLKARGDDKRLLFHVSDEPQAMQIPQYQRVKNAVKDLLAGYPVMDALSHYEFYEQGIVETPIVSIRSIDTYLDHGVKDLWAYTSCAPTSGGSNRFIPMPLWRTRGIGLALYKYAIKGFLHWGFNFYNNMQSFDSINPYIETSGENCMPAGDAFLVYPTQNGTPNSSIRQIAFYEALEDVRALTLCESFYGRDRVIAEMERALGDDVQFMKSVQSSEQMLRVRNRINDMIADALLMKK